MSSPDPQKIPSLRAATRYFRRLLILIRPYWGLLVKSILMSVVLGLLGLTTPYITKLLIDEVYPAENLGLLNVLVFALLALGLTSTLAGTLSSYFSLYVNMRLNNATSLMFFNHLQHLEASFFDRHQVGEILSRFQDVTKALNSINQVFQTVFVQGIYLFLVPPMLFLLEWRLALLAIISLPLTLVVTALSGRLLRRHWKNTSEAYAEMSAFQVETLSHIRTFKAMGLEHKVYRKARDLIQAAMHHQLQAGGYSHSFGAVNGVLRGLNTALLTWFGWRLILSHQMSLGDYIAFSAYIGFLYNPLSQLIALFSQFQQSAVNLTRMFEYLDDPVEQDPNLAYSPPAPIRHRLSGSFCLRQLSFAYNPGQPVLREVDLDIPAGTVTALVGPSGSGKTTLLRLLAGMARADAGGVSIDGYPINSALLPDLRRQLSVVWQEVSLIKGTLWENLTLGADGSSAQEVDRVVDLCGLGGLLADLPEGYETEVGEWGASLSAGQRQRVAIARALIRDTPILLFDEATANVDVETEQRILREVFSHLRGKSVVYVTHRLATAAMADQVSVLEEGRLVGVGKHRELLETCEPYRRMHMAAADSSSSRLRVMQEGE